MELADPFRVSLALPDLEQRTDDVTHHVRQEPVRDDPNLEHRRMLVATGSNPAGGPPGNRSEGSSA